MWSQVTKLCNLDFPLYVSQTDFCVNTYRTHSSLFNYFCTYLENTVKPKEVKNHL